METIKVKFSGKRLIMKSDRSVNSLDPEVKKLAELTSKRKKTDDDRREIARRDWELALYYDKDAGVYLPSWNMVRSILEGGKLNRLGTAIDRAVQILDDILPLKYNGPREIDELWAKNYYDCRSVGIGDKRTMRYRPMFRNWSVSAEIFYEPTIISRDDLMMAMENAGKFIGVGDYRPRFGRYEIEVVQ